MEPPSSLFDKIRARAAKSAVAAKPRTIFGSPVPDNQWPIWAKALKQLSTESDRGIGDVVARVIGEDTSEAFKSWFESTFKKKCGCTGRQARWNIEYPL